MTQGRLARLLIVFLSLLLGQGAAAMGPSPPPPPPPLDAGGDDLFLIQAAVEPNVVLVMDNSDSMNAIEWHPSFDPGKTPDATYCSSSSDFGGALDPNTIYTVTGNVNNASCDTPNRGNRTVYGPNSPTYWDGRYLMWYLGLANNDPILDEIDNEVASVAGCTQAGGAGAFAEKYRRTRFEAMQQVLLDLLCVAEPKNVRFGAARFRNADDAGGVDPNGGYVFEDLGRSNPNHAAQLEAALKNVNPASTDGTPLAETMFQLYTYWMARTTADIPFGADGITKFPIYEFDKKGDRVASNKWFEDTMLYDCEKAFFVIVTDGLPSRDDFDQDPVDTALAYSDYMDLIGNYHTDAETEDPGAANEATYYLDDIAKYMFDHDFRPDLAGDQTIDTYTVGFATETATDDFLTRTAQLGNGTFYKVQNGDQLTNALIAALNDIIEKSASFTAATVPSVRTSDGADFYQSYFIPRGKNAFWEGHIRAWKIDAAGNILDKNGVCALDDPTPGECNSGPFKPDAEYFWDAAEEVPSPTSRNLYVSKTGVTTGSLPPAFTQANLSAADLQVPAFTAPPAQAPNDPLYLVNGSTATTEEGLADEIVEAARGCFFGSGVPLNVATPLPCLARPSRLGDIFHSNAVTIRKPLGFINEPSYVNFKNHYVLRKRVFYAGTNAGFLEALDAGDVVSGSYDEGTGEEIFGFMPWEPRLKIKNLPIDAATSRSHYVDGDVNSADVWVHPTASTPPTSKNVSGSEWKTILVGALREGGHHYYALDVTHPDPLIPATAPGGGSPPDYPAYMWEFPTEADTPGDLPFMGETWGRAIITKIRLEDPANASLTVERWVAVVTAGYDAASDPNPDTVTGVTSSYDAVTTAHAVKGRGVFILDMKTGEVIAEQKFGAPGAAHQAAMKYATVATPAVLDLDFDGYADVIYVSDMGGQIFKWVIKDVGKDRVNDGSGLRTQPNWTWKLFFQTAPQTVSGDTYYKNFFFPPAVAYKGGKLYVSFASGERRSLPTRESPVTIRRTTAPTWSWIPIPSRSWGPSGPSTKRT